MEWGVELLVLLYILQHMILVHEVARHVYVVSYFMD